MRTRAVAKYRLSTYNLHRTSILWLVMHSKRLWGPQLSLSPRDSSLFALIQPWKVCLLLEHSCWALREAAALPLSGLFSCSLGRGVGCWNLRSRSFCRRAQGKCYISWTVLAAWPYHVAKSLSPRSADRLLSSPLVVRKTLLRQRTERLEVEAVRPGKG